MPQPQPQPQHGSLLVDDLIGHSQLLTVSESATLGRQGDILLASDDPAMHRTFLQVWSNGSQWFLKNVGTFIAATIQPPAACGYGRTVLSPGSIEVLHPGTSTVYFSTATMSYECELTVMQPLRSPEPSLPPDGPFTTHVFEPNEEQCLLLKTLAQPLVENPAAEPRVVVGTQRELAEALGWTEKKVERKIQTLAETLQKLGVPQFQPGQKISWRIVLAQFAAAHPQYYAHLS